jgi:hypothetical protein
MPKIDYGAIQALIRLAAKRFMKINLDDAYQFLVMAETKGFDIREPYFEYEPGQFSGKLRCKLCGCLLNIEHGQLIKPKFEKYCAECEAVWSALFYRIGMKK